MRHVWHPQAEAEFDEAIDYYLAEAGNAIGRKLTSAVGQTLALVREHPAIGKPVLNQARSMPLQGFPFDLVYRVLPDRLVIVALANHSRRPGYWAGRR